MTSCRIFLFPVLLYCEVTKLSIETQIENFGNFWRDVVFSFNQLLQFLTNLSFIIQSSTWGGEEDV